MREPMTDEQIRRWKETGEGFHTDEIADELLRVRAEVKAKTAGHDYLSKDYEKLSTINHGLRAEVERQQRKINELLVMYRDANREILKYEAENKQLKLKDYVGLLDLYKNDNDKLNAEVERLKAALKAKNLIDITAENTRTAELVMALQAKLAAHEEAMKVVLDWFIKARVGEHPISDAHKMREILRARLEAK